jgi:WD repeat-containing protein 48
MLSPPTAAEGGHTLPLAPDILLFIAEERPLGWTSVYRGTIASVGSAEDLATQEDMMPVWLLEYLLLGRAPQVAIIKIQFALLPGEEQLPELVSSCWSFPLVPSQVANRACMGFLGGGGFRLL